MKITMYELLGMVKDGKAPKKIKYEDNIYELDDEKMIWTDKIYHKVNNHHLWLNFSHINSLNAEVEILDDDDEEKGLPEKLEGIDSLFEIGQDLDLKSFLAWQKANNKIIENKINSIIDYLEKQKKGE